MNVSLTAKNVQNKLENNPSLHTFFKLPIPWIKKLQKLITNTQIIYIYNHK